MRLIDGDGGAGAQGVSGLRRHVQARAGGDPALSRTVPNLQLVGRNGMHRYNNQDHSMLTAMLAARNILGGHYNLWQINADEEYHEEGGELTEKEIRNWSGASRWCPRGREFARHSLAKC